jgi:glycosyltransferase involved in cell wall biosynthesis
MIAAALCRVPVRIYHLHGLRLMTATGLKRRILRWTDHTACWLAHQVICVSESVRGVAIAEGLCSAEKIEGVGTRKHRRHRGRRKVQSRPRLRGVAPACSRPLPHPGGRAGNGFRGTHRPRQGAIELVQSWRTLRDEYPSLHLLVAGQFESQDPIPADVEATLRSDPRIHLAGMVHDMPSIYRTLDLLALPTYREGFPASLLEASAMELPVIATRIPGCVDAVRDGETGLLVPVRDAEALTAAIRIYLADPTLRRQHGVNGRRRALRDFDPEMLRAALFQEYLRLLVERGCAEVVKHVSPVARAVAP